MTAEKHKPREFDGLIFMPIKAYCPGCRALVRVTVEGLRYEDEVIRPKCGLNFISKIDVDALLRLMREVENNSRETD